MSFDAGKYIGKITAHGFDESTEKKTPYLRIDFEVVAVFDSDEDGYFEVPEAKRATRNVTLWFTDKSAERSIANVRKYAKWTGTDLKELNGDVLVDSEIEVICKGQDDQGYDDFDLPRGEGKPATKNDEVMKALRNKFNKFVKASVARKASESKSRRRAHGDTKKKADAKADEKSVVDGREDEKYVDPKEDDVDGDVPF